MVVVGKDDELEEWIYMRAHPGPWVVRSDKGGDARQMSGAGQVRPSAIGRCRLLAQSTNEIAIKSRVKTGILGDNHESGGRVPEKSWRAAHNQRYLAQQPRHLVGGSCGASRNTRSLPARVGVRLPSASPHWWAPTHLPRRNHRSGCISDRI